MLEDVTGNVWVMVPAGVVLGALSVAGVWVRSARKSRKEREKQDWDRFAKS